MLMDYWIIDDGRVWPRKKAMCMSELEEGGHDDGGGDRDGGDGGDGDNNREEKKAKI